MRQKTARGMHAEFSIEESAEKHCENSKSREREK